MPHILALRQHSTPEDFFDPVEAALKRRGFLPASGSLDTLAVSRTPDVRDQFEMVAGTIRSQGAIRHVVVDSVKPYDLQPLKGKGWSSLIAMLILAFPEIRWTFATVAGCPVDETNPQCECKKFRHDRGVATLLDIRSSPLFDGYGLREWIVGRINAVLGVTDEHSPVARRSHTAVVLDEEQAYSQFTALMCYRNGFRTHAVETWAEAKRLLHDEPASGEESKEPPRTEPMVTIEDLFLNFPDHGGETENSRLGQRAEHLNALDLPGRNGSQKKGARHVIRRRFLTVGHRLPIRREGQEISDADWKETLRERQEHWKLLRERESVVHGKKLRLRQQRIYKPAAGLYTLWGEMGFNGAFLDDNTGKRSGHAPGYQWPPAKSKEHVVESHSAEGRLKQIAEFLLHRANDHLASANTVAESVHGTVLATNALELLCCKTPTLSQEALSLKHQFEVMAECQFPGVEYHLSMHERIKDIRSNLLVTAQWLRKERREEFRYNGGAQILSRLIAILEAHNEFEEAEFCRSRLRSLNKRIELRDSVRRRKPAKWLVTRIVGTYTDFVLRSLTHFVLTWFALLGVFVLLFYFTAMSNGTEFSKAGHQAVDSFLTISVYSPGSDPPIRWWYPLSYLAAAAGAMNIGLLVTHLYSRMARQ